MENAVQSQNLDFLGGRVSELHGVLRGYVGRDNDIAC